MSTMATTGSNLFVGTQTISGSIIPAVDNTYDLGSVTHQFRDLYLSSASLYIDGTKVLSSTTQELQITTDAGQSFKILEAGSDTITLQSGDGNITLASSGGGDVIMDPTNGIIALKGTTTLYAGNRILSSDGNAIQFGNSVTMTGSLTVSGYIETQELRTTYISSSILYRSGSTKFGDELGDTHSFTGSLTVSGSISVPDSGLVSGSSQITYSGLTGVPSGIISGSLQLPSGLVSGSVQVDVMSTTNIVQLATTGSNSFSGTQTWGYGRLTGNYNSSAGITINASYDGGQSNTYTPDYSGDSSAGMFVMKQSAGGYGDFHFYGKNHQTTGGSHDLSSFNVIMGMNTNGRVAVGKLYANETLDVNGNALVSGSITSTNNITSVGLTNNGAYSQSTTSTEPVMIYGDSAGSNGLFRIQIDEVNDGFGTGVRTYLGDGGIDIFLGTANGLYTPGNTYIALNHSGEISMGAGSGTKHFTLSTSGNVGINIPNPNAKLEIGNGNLRLTEIGTSSFDISYSGGKTQFGMDSAGSDGFYFRSYSGGYADRFIINSNGNVDIRGTVKPLIDATYDLGSTSLRWNNLYTTDLHLSNEGKENVVDGTWGDWTLQEGENDIYMLNNRSGEKFKIKLEKIIE
jgi:hypothetical protein